MSWPLATLLCVIAFCATSLAWLTGLVKATRSSVRDLDEDTSDPDDTTEPN